MQKQNENIPVRFRTIPLWRSGQKYLNKYLGEVMLGPLFGGMMLLRKLYNISLVTTVIFFVVHKQQKR